MSPPRQLPDVLIAGAGVIGLSLALELRRQGAQVTVLERATAMGGASTAAAGMLAAEDPHNPPALLPLARYSLSLYPQFLASLQQLSGQAIPFQTDTTVQYLPHGSPQRLSEHSIDPRQLAAALLAAARAVNVRILENTSIASLQTTPAGVAIRTHTGEVLETSGFVRTTGAWTLPSSTGLAGTISPRKGQMLRVIMPAVSLLQEVHRAEHVYVVPRTTGPQAGSALIGATIEDAGFDLSTHAAQLDQLRAHAAALGPATAFVADAPLLEAWAGLRPSTPDGLPLLGALGDTHKNQWIASGHFRNGILLAPGTAGVLADLLAGRSAAVDLAAFAPDRVVRSSSAH